VLSARIGYGPTIEYEIFKELPMKRMSTLILLVFSSFCAVLVFAQNYEVPRTQWGQPDLQGVWNFSSNVPMQRPSRFGERQFLTEEEIAEAEVRRAAADANSDGALPIEGVDGSYNDFWIENAGIGGNVRTSHIISPSDGRMPSLAEGAVIQRGVYGGSTTGDSRPVRISAGGIGTDGPEDRGLSERCIIGFNAGPPFVPSLYNNNVQIFQSKHTAVLMTEMIHDARVVQLYESAAAIGQLDDDVRLWTGDSRGYWDGDTLVVVTKNFNGMAASFGSTGTSYDKVLTERFSRKGPYTVDYEFTIDDPSTYTDKFTAIVSMTKVGGLLYEYACHEGNYGMENILRGARVQERLQAEGLL
jgi:hypothetical protein|tara:strand:- start:3796 stop:4869 length:1074 start_codon:yes stop_codon:yes gene_type:complete